MIITVVRFILRTVFVIVTLYLSAIALMAISLLCLAFLITLTRKGGCSLTMLYILCELVLGTIWWIVILYVLDTNDLCREVSGACNEVETSQLSSDYIVRPKTGWLALLIPGILFDLLFLWFFR